MFIKFEKKIKEFVCGRKKKRKSSLLLNLVFFGGKNVKIWLENWNENAKNNRGIEKGKFPLLLIWYIVHPFPVQLFRAKIYFDGKEMGTIYRVNQSF